MTSGDAPGRTGTPVELADLTAAVKALREDNARLAQEVTLTRQRAGWILLLAMLLLVFGSCATSDDDGVSQVRSEVGTVQRQLRGDGSTDVAPGEDVRSVQLEQCRMIGRIGKGVAVAPVGGAAPEGESDCAKAAREAFTGVPAP